MSDKESYFGAGDEAFELILGHFNLTEDELIEAVSLYITLQHTAAEIPFVGINHRGVFLIVDGSPRLIPWIQVYILLGRALPDDLDYFVSTPTLVN